MSAVNTAPVRPVRVEVTEDADMISVHPIWEGVDRPDVGGWGLPKTASGRKLVKRLVAACESGAAFSATELCTDNGGQTYIHATHAVMGRYMNADLKRLGY